MIIKFALCAALALIFLYAVSQRRRAFALSLVMALVSVASTVFVLSPDLANIIANAVGVGRGADLVLYSFVILVLAALFNIHLRFRAERETITDLAREIAILSSEWSERSK